MKPPTFVKTFLYLLLTLICVSNIGCGGPDFGDKIDANKTDIFYKDGATKADAERLRAQLEEMGFIDGKRKSVQLRKRGDVWEFRMATSKVAQDEKTQNPLKPYCLELSSAFDGDEVEVHLCNQKLETKSIIKGLRGKRYKLGKNNYYYEDIDLEQVKNFAAIAFGTQLDTGIGFNYHLSKPSAVEILMPYPNTVEGDKRLANAAYGTAVAASNRVFDGNQVDVFLCDAYFGKQASFSSAQKSATASP